MVCSHVLLMASLILRFWDPQAALATLTYGYLSFSKLPRGLATQLSTSLSLN